LTTLHDGDTGIRRSQINANNLAHDVFLK